MKIIKIILISSLITISSCGYKIVNKIEKSDFKITETVFKGDSKINKKLDNNFKRYIQNENATRSFKISVKSQSARNITSKDTSGKVTGYTLEITTFLEIYENNKKLNKFEINKKVDYDNLDSQFELKQYEKNLTNDLVGLIIIDINNYLLSIQ